jgi:lysocardiolipin and lysophospholipid acyltransferase
VTGLYHILSQLEGSNIEYIYDLTMGLSGITADDIPEDVYRILDCYWKGENASEIHIRVRRWHIPTQVPIQDGPEVFNEWLRARWMEKDEMLKRFYATGSLAVGETESERRLETVIKPMRVRSILWTLVPVFILWGLFWLICRTLFRILS